MKHKHQNNDADLFLIKLKTGFLGILAAVCLSCGIVLGIINRSWITMGLAVVTFIILKYYADYIHFKYKRRSGYIIHNG